MGTTFVPSLIAIDAIINQVETNLSLITICCHKLFVVVKKRCNVML